MTLDPGPIRSVEDAGTGSVGYDGNDLGVELATRTGIDQRLAVCAAPRSKHHNSALRLGHDQPFTSFTRSAEPSWATVSPMTQVGSSIAAWTAATSSGRTTNTMPTPQLKI